jgi:hypothetical protein
LGFVLLLVHHPFLVCCELAIVSFVACMSEFLLSGRARQAEGITILRRSCAAGVVADDISRCACLSR